MKVSVTGDVPDTPALSALEIAVLKLALAGDGLDRLRDQAEQAQIASRTYSGVGFVSKFRLPEAIPPAGDAQPTLVLGTHPRLPDAVEFLVELRGGRLHSLEAYCYEGMWPGDEAGFKLHTRT